MTPFSIAMQIPVVKRLLQNLAIKRAAEKVSIIKPYISHNHSILEVGSGNGAVTRLIREGGFTIEALDIVNLSFWDDTKPVIYDGRMMPFKDNTFDTAMLITVLHHIAQPEVVLREACRVAKRVIIIEEIYTSIFSNYMTFAVDSLFNMEFIGHPHTNKTDRGWKATFNRLHLKLESCSYSTSLGVLQRALYVVQNDGARY